MVNEAKPCTSEHNWFKVHIDMLTLDILVFGSDESRVQTLTDKGYSAEPWDPIAIASTHVDTNKEGSCAFSIVLKNHAEIPIIAHECLHMVDFVCDYYGIPINLESNEVRAYMLQYLMTEILEKKDVLYE